MKKNYTTAFFLFVCLFFCGCFYEAQAQQGFSLPKGQKKLKISFEYVNKLMVVPVTINNVPLSFILDTGVASSILFSATNDTLVLNNSKIMDVRGLGINDTIKALQSRNNRFRIGNIEDKHHTLFAILDKQWDISNKMGVPIHGILGYDLFSKFVVAINYVSKTITFYDPLYYKKKKCKKCHISEISIIKKKPYISDISINNNDDKSLLLIDTGSSDAIWLFDEEEIIRQDPPNYFNDYLGFGLGGNIYGKRTKLQQIQLGDFQLNNINLAIPTYSESKTLGFIKERKGSIGSDFLSRFHLIIDYPNKRITFKKNGYYNTPFYYNMSGISLENGGVVVVKQLQSSSAKIYGIESKTTNAQTSSFSLNYTYKLSPQIVVSEVQENSPAAEVDIRKGDEIISVNGKKGYDYKLFEIIALFSSKSQRKISLTISRNGQKYKKKFRLKPLL